MRSDQRSSIPTINSTLFMTAFGRDADIPIDMSGAFVSQEAANYITERFEGVYEVCSHFLSAVHYSNPLALDGEEDKPACGVDWALSKPRKRTPPDARVEVNFASFSMFKLHNMRLNLV